MKEGLYGCGLFIAFLAALAFGLFVLHAAAQGICNAFGLHHPDTATTLLVVGIMGALYLKGHLRQKRLDRESPAERHARQQRESDEEWQRLLDASKKHKRD